MQITLTKVSSFIYYNFCFECTYNIQISTFRSFVTKEEVYWEKYANIWYITFVLVADIQFLQMEYNNQWGA